MSLHLYPVGLTFPAGVALTNARGQAEFVGR
jgi:hypothetical protein